MITLETTGVLGKTDYWPTKRIDCPICRASVEFMYSMPRLCTSCLSFLDINENMFRDAEKRLAFHRRLSDSETYYGETW